MGITFHEDTEEWGKTMDIEFLPFSKVVLTETDIQAEMAKFIGKGKENSLLADFRDSKLSVKPAKYKIKPYDFSIEDELD